MMKPDIGGELLPAEFGRDPNADDDCFAAKNCRNVFAYGRGLFSLAQNNAQRAGDVRYWETADIGSHSRDFAQQPMGRKNGRENRPFGIVFRGVSPADGALGGTGRAALLPGRGFLLQRGLFQCRIYRDPDGAKRAGRRRSLSDIVMIGLLQYTVGLFMITGDRGKMKAGAVLKNPVVLSVALGVLLYAANIPKPALAVSLFSTVGSINTPLVMLLLGAYLAKDKSKTSFCRHLKLWGLLCAAAAYPGGKRAAAAAAALWQRANESLRLSGGKPGRHFSPEIWRGL